MKPQAPDGAPFYFASHPQPAQPSQHSVAERAVVQNVHAYEPLQQHYHPSRQTAVYKSPPTRSKLQKNKPLFTVNDCLDFKPPKTETPQPPPIFTEQR